MIFAKKMHRALRARSWSLFQKSNKKFCSKIYNISLIFYYKDRLSWLVYCHFFENKEIRFLQAFLRSEDTFVDVGANFGLFSCVAAQLVGPKGKIIAIEPSVSAYFKLIENIRLNGFCNIMLLNAVASDRECLIDFGDWGGELSAWSSVGDLKGEKQKALSVRLDRIIDGLQLKHPPKMVKIDVEGWEAHVLDGMQGIFEHELPVLQIEFNEDALHHSEASCALLETKLLNTGYKLFCLNEEHGKLKFLPYTKSLSQSSVNVFAIPTNYYAAAFEALKNA